MFLLSAHSFSSFETFSIRDNNSSTFDIDSSSDCVYASNAKRRVTERWASLWVWEMLFECFRRWTRGSDKFSKRAPFRKSYACSVSLKIKLSNVSRKTKHKAASHHLPKRIVFGVRSVFVCRIALRSQREYRCTPHHHRWMNNATAAH